MTYFGVLATFILPPLIVLIVLTCQDIWRGLRSAGLAGLRRVQGRPYRAILLHVFLALIYTTPWDNYLVATGVWWYDPRLVTGIRFGYVPIEEYTFFVLQTLLTGFWVLGWMRWRFPEPAVTPPAPTFRKTAVAVTVILWITSTAVLYSGWQPGAYLTLILSWALVPILIQLAFGADLLLLNWRLALTGIFPPTLYLWWVDSLAITSGTWTIDPQQTTGIMIGTLPIEEMLFFFLTNVIIVFGMTLFLSPAGNRRIWELVRLARVHDRLLRKRRSETSG